VGGILVLGTWERHGEQQDSEPYGPCGFRAAVGIDLGSTGLEGSVLMVSTAVVLAS